MIYILKITITTTANKFLRAKLFFLIEVFESLEELTSTSANNNSNIKYLNTMWSSNETASLLVLKV